MRHTIISQAFPFVNSFLEILFGADFVFESKKTPRALPLEPASR